MKPHCNQRQHTRTTHASRISGTGIHSITCFWLHLHWALFLDTSADLRKDNGRQAESCSSCTQHVSKLKRQNVRLCAESRRPMTIVQPSTRQKLTINVWPYCPSPSSVSESPSCAKLSSGSRSRLGSPLGPAPVVSARYGSLTVMTCSVHPSIQATIIRSQKAAQCIWALQATHRAISLDPSRDNVQLPQC